MTARSLAATFAFSLTAVSAPAQDALRQAMPSEGIVIVKQATDLRRLGAPDVHIPRLGPRSVPRLCHGGHDPLHAETTGLEPEGHRLPEWLPSFHDREVG